MENHIPKRIIQIWIGKNLDLPLFEKAASANIKLLHPNYEYILFDDEKVEAFIKQQPSTYQKTFHSFNFTIQKVDFFRYLAIYNLGGFYFDLDVLLASNLSPLLDRECVFSFEDLNISRFLRRSYGMDWAIGNYAFGAAPGHPFLKAVIENCVRAQKDPAWVEPMMRGIPRLFRPEFLVLNTSGPTLVSRTLAENPALAETVTVLFPDDVCDSRNRQHFGNFGIHLMKGNWRTNYGWLRRRLAGAWEVWTYQTLLKESRKLGKTRPVVPNGKPVVVKQAPAYVQS